MEENREMKKDKYLLMYGISLIVAGIISIILYNIFFALSISVFIQFCACFLRAVFFSRIKINKVLTFLT